MNHSSRLFFLVELRKEKLSLKLFREAQTLEHLEREQAPLLESLAKLDTRIKEAESNLDMLIQQSHSKNERLEKARQCKEKTLEELEKARQGIQANESKRNALASKEAELENQQKRILQKLLQAKVEKKENERQKQTRQTLANLCQLFPGKMA